MGNIILYVFVLGLVQICTGLHMIAYFDQKDIRGYVKFGQHNLGGNLEIQFNFTATLRSFNEISFKITKGPSVYNDFCDNVGDVISDLSKYGYITPKSKFTDNTEKIMGKDSIFGNSLSLYEKNNTKAIACSTVLPHGDVTYATANIFSTTVGGSFNFIQNKKDNTGNTFVYGSVKDNSNNLIARDYDVYISADTAYHETCDPLNQVYNPTEKSGSCTKNQESTCKLGALSQKHDRLSIGKSGSGILQGVDTNLPLTGSHSITSRYVVMKKGNTIVGCGKINIAGPLQVVSIFNSKVHKGISGYLKFSQQSPYHFTMFETKLNGLGERVKSYHVHRFPISDVENPCSGTSVGGHVNTWKVNIKESPKPFKGSLDKYEVGDLSGRYGGLNDKDSYTHETTDANLPLYGLHTILGRSIVIHANDGSRFICSNIEPDNYKLKMSSLANFSAVEGSSVSGTVHSVQYVQENGIVTRTISIVDLKHKDGSKTSDHKWSVHKKSVHGNKCPEKNSQSNPIYNPVEVAGSFCSEKNPFLCPIGDLSGKVGKYNMKMGKSFFSDENLPMFDGMTSLGRSVVFYKADGSDLPLACANIVPLTGLSVSKLSFNVKDTKLKDDTNQLHLTLMKAFGFQSAQGYRVNSLKTSLIEDNDDCFQVEFYMIDTNTPPNAAYYNCALNDVLKSPEKMEPYKWCAPPSSSSFVIIPSMVLVASSIIASILI